MKKVLAVLLALALFLCGCTAPQAGSQNTVNFYYPVRNIDFSMGSTYIQAEQRTDASPTSSLHDTLDLYLKGPLDRTAYSIPFQHNTKVESISRDTNTLDITLSRGFATYTGLRLTVACACITMTCLELSDAQVIRIRAKDTTLDGAAYIEMSAETLLLMDQGKDLQE